MGELMLPEIQDIERRLVETAELIKRQEQLVASTRAYGLPIEAPMRLLTSMVRHFKMLEDQRSRMMRVPSRNTVVDWVVP